MTIGSVGDVLFGVSAEQVQTIDNVSMSKSINYGAHKLHGGNTLLEFVGCDPIKLTFTIEASAYLGVDPQAVIDQLDAIASAGEAVDFVLGAKIYGLFVITDINKEFKQIFKDGTLISALIKLSLQEYGGM
ncbi:MAG: phage tail protein [Clostridia bacterium]